MIGFIGGTGPEGRGLALRFCMAGEQVLIGSRDPDRARQAASEVQAKTGTYYVYDAMNRRRLLTSKALGGYMRAATGRQLAFSIVVNNVHLSDKLTPNAIGEDLGAIATAIQQTH